MFGRKAFTLHFALHFAYDNAQNRALVFEHSSETPELLGMGVAASLEPQRFAFFGKSLFELALQVLGFDRLNCDGHVDSGLEQQLHAPFAQVAAKAPYLRGVAWQPVFIVGHAAEVRPQDVLAPMYHQLFVAEVEAVLEVQQAGHQANGQPGPPGVAATRTQQYLGVPNLSWLSRVWPARFWRTNFAATAASL